MIRELVRTVMIGAAIVAGVRKGLRTHGSKEHESQPPREHRRPRRILGIPPKRLIAEIVILAMLGGVAALTGAALGLPSIKASSGHWWITEKFLQFTKRRSVATHSLGIDEPKSIEDRAMIVKGAAHYESACRPCHGSPELPEPLIANAMEPPAPYLPTRLQGWKSREMFYVVKHGIKMTGMPAWPAQTRDDEVWAMVAFLRAFRDGLTADEYAMLARGSATRDASTVVPMEELAGPPPRPVSENCVRCHGVDGNVRGAGAFPRLGGQHAQYLFNALDAYGRGARHSGIMQPVARGLSREERVEVARWYASRSGIGSHGEAMPEVTSEGARIAMEGIPSKRVPACRECHGPAPEHKNEAYPMLDGQQESYLVLQLELFREGHRGGSKWAHLMEPVASRLDDDEIRAVARWYAGR